MAPEKNVQGLLDMPMTYLVSMKANPEYKWFKPILGAVLGIAIYVLIATVLATIGVVLDMPGFTSNTVANPEAYLQIDFTDPVQIALITLSVAAMIPVVGVGAKVAGMGGIKSISSLEGRLRWDRFVKLGIPAFTMAAFLITATTVVPAVIDGDLNRFSSPTVAPLALLAIVVCVPLQCAGEEYVFRGYVMQAFGSWIPSAIVVIIFQSILFSSLHGYNLIGNIEVGISGFLWGYLTARTGGLEASIVLHSVNNVCVFILSSIFVNAAVTVEQTIDTAIIDILVTVILAILVFGLCKKYGYLIKSE